MYWYEYGPKEMLERVVFALALAIVDRFDANPEKLLQRRSTPPNHQIVDQIRSVFASD
jgi:hypothetical protein